jgi:hypothetical protein
MIREPSNVRSGTNSRPGRRGNSASLDYRILEMRKYVRPPARLPANLEHSPLPVAEERSYAGAATASGVVQQRVQSDLTWLRLVAGDSPGWRSHPTRSRVRACFRFGDNRGALVRPPATSLHDRFRRRKRYRLSITPRCFGIVERLLGPVNGWAASVAGRTCDVALASQLPQSGDARALRAAPWRRRILLHQCLPSFARGAVSACRPARGRGAGAVRQAAVFLRCVSVDQALAADRGRVAIPWRGRSSRSTSGAPMQSDRFGNARRTYPLSA